MKYYKDLTPEEARDWLMRKDKEAIDFWRTAPYQGLVSAVKENLRDFGDNDDEVFFIPRSVSIGFVRNDGDVQLLATHNNVDELLSPDCFMELISNTVGLYERTGIDKNIKVWFRFDAPDYLSFDPDEPGEFIEIDWKLGAL